MAAPAHILVLSTSHRGGSRSEQIAIRCGALLEQAGAIVDFISLKDHEFPPLVVDTISDSTAYRALYPIVQAADGIVISSPVYNWSLSGALKEFIEHIGSTDGELRAALLDKVVTFVCSGGLPHGYMAFSSTALSLMLDFRCIINPYQVYLYDDCWDGGELIEESDARVRRSMTVMMELTTLLAARTYISDWSV